MRTLYHAPTSVCSQKVRIALALLDLPYESRLMNLRTGVQFAPEYRALNPDAVVPTLVDDQITVVESSVIIDYLDREYNGGRLMPADRARRVKAQHWLLRCLHIHAAINTLSFSTAFRAQIMAKSTPEDVDALAGKFPDPVMGAKRRDLLLNGTASPYIGQALMYLRRMFEDMQAQLVEDWLGGAAPGLADIALVAYIDRLERLGLAGLWSAYPAVGPWLDRWRATPAYATAIEALIPEGSQAQMRAEGSAAWPALRTRWTQG